MSVSIRNTLLPLADARLEDVFRSTQENFQGPPAMQTVLMLLAGAAAIVLLLVLVNRRHKAEAAAKPLNHHGKLVREVRKSVPIRAAEWRQLHRLAERQSCSPLVLMLCPSLLAKGIQGKSQAPSQKTE